MIFGTGFPAFRGGLLRYADSIGIDKVVSRLEQLNSKYPYGAFKPSKYLLNLRDAHKRFYQ
jgi:3-hydroxyacyl-CoA dehydrogenase/enoyl-CoA hydratase/3-hydroxybutyryl-CoA epimerase